MGRAASRRSTFRVSIRSRLRPQDGSSSRRRRPRRGSREQLKLVRGAGSKGRQLYADVRSYVAGINAYYKKRNQGLRPWTMTDVIAVGSLLGANLGVGGGDETRRSLFLDALRRRVGLERAPVLWDRLAERQDAEAPVSVDGRFSYDPGPALQSGNVVLRDGSFEPSGTSPTFHFENPVAASNALLVSARALGDRPSARSSPARRSATATRSCCSSSTCTEAASTHAACRSPASASTCCSVAARTSPGARPRLTRTSSTSTSRRCAAATTSTTSTKASAAR